MAIFRGFCQLGHTDLKKVFLDKTSLPSAMLLKVFVSPVHLLHLTYYWRQMIEGIYYLSTKLCYSVVEISPQISQEWSLQ